MEIGHTTVTTYIKLLVDAKVADMGTSEGSTCSSTQIDPVLIILSLIAFVFRLYLRVVVVRQKTFRVTSFSLPDSISFEVASCLGCKNLGNL